MNKDYFCHVVREQNKKISYVILFGVTKPEVISFTNKYYMEIPKVVDFKFYKLEENKAVELPGGKEVLQTENEKELLMHLMNKLSIDRLTIFENDSVYLLKPDGSQYKLIDYQTNFVKIIPTKETVKKHYELLKKRLGVGLEDLKDFIGEV